MQRSRLIGGFVAGGILLFPALAHADPTVFFDDVAGGRSSFDSQIAIANATPTLDPLAGLISGMNSWARSGYAIAATNGVNRVVNTTYLAGGAPATYTGGGDGVTMTADGSTTSGLTFTFASPINAFGLELGDWATCCFPSALYISFDGGSPILVGSANVNTDNPGVGAGDGARTFIAAIDDTGTFSTITFYGAAAGDVLYAGGIIRYAAVPLGSLSGDYVVTAAPTAAEGAAAYLDKYDGSPPLAMVASYLNASSEGGVVNGLKKIFPVNTGAAAQSMSGVMGQNTTFLIDKVGTVLGDLGARPSALSFREGQGAAFAGWAMPAKEGQMSPAAFSLAPEDEDILTALSRAPYQEFRDGDHAFWMEGVASLSHSRDSEFQWGAHSVSKGTVAGYEVALNKKTLLGFMGSVFDTHINLDSETGSTDAVNWSGGIYAQRLMGDFKFSFIGLLGQGQYESTREVDLSGVVGSPHADYTGTSASATLAVSHLYNHTQKGLQFEPFGLINYTAVKTGGYTETGGNVFNMDVAGDRSSTLSFRSGVTLLYKGLLWDRALHLRLKPYVGYRLDIEDLSNRVRLVGTSVTDGTMIAGRSTTGANGGLAFEIKHEFAPDNTVKLGFDLSHDQDDSALLFYVGYGLRF